MPRELLFGNRQPGGAAVVVAPGAIGTTGSTFWVDSTTGSDSASYGQSPDTPFATLDYAIGKCTAGKGDRIYLMPGHAETLTATTTCTLDVTGVQVVGLGRGTLQATFTLGTDKTATITVSGASCSIENIKVISDVADQAVGITVSATADGFTLKDCWLTDGGLTKELVIGVSIAALCTDVTIENCRFMTTVSAETGGCASAVKAVGAADRLRIAHCYVNGHFTAAAFDLDQAACADVWIEDNHIIQIDTDAGLGISNHASTTGAVIRNLVANLKDTVAGISGAGALVAENYGSNAAGASGLIKPAVDS